ncbi:hypothetical protein J7643_07195 [bacterium]|nr:hypothetical protein [bacterium]
MKTTYSREAFVKSPTADLSQKVDDILDRRFQESKAHASEPEPSDAADPGPLNKVRSLLKGISSRK